MTPKRPCGVMTSIVSPGWIASLQSVENSAAFDFLHRDAQFAVVEPGADRIGAADVLRRRNRGAR